MRKHRFRSSWLLALVIVAAMISGSLLPVAAVQASGTALDSYDSATDIGSVLLPNGEYTASLAYRNEMIFKAVRYHQSSYNMTVDAIYQENENTKEDSLRFIVAKAKDSYNGNAEVTIEIVVCGKNVHIFARQSSGTQTTIRDFFKSNGEPGKSSSFAIRYSNRKIWFYENDQKVISGVNLADYSRFTDIEPYVGLAFLFTGGTYSNLHLWGKGIEYYGQFPPMPKGNGDYADYIGVKYIQGTSTTYENGVLKNTERCADLVSFTKLPFTNKDTYAWSFEVNVEDVEKSYHGVRPIIRADEKFKNMYQLVITEGSVIVMYNSTEIQKTSYKRTLGQTDKFGMVVGPNTISVWVNDVLVLDNVYLEHELPANMGVKYENAKATIRNMDFYYTEPTKFVAPEADPTIPVLTGSMYNGARYMKVMAGSKEVAYGNYTVIPVANTGNKYTFENLSLQADADYTIRTNLTMTKGFEKPYYGPRIMFRTSKQGEIYVAFCASSIKLLVGGGTELESYPMKVEIGKTYDVAINSNQDEVNVWIDGKLIFNRVPLSKTGEKTKAKAGILYENCEATLANMKIYGKSIVLTDDIFSLELHNNPYFNADSVPKKPDGNIDYFTNVKLSESKSRGKYADGTLQIPITSSYNAYTFVDQNNSKALNGLKKTNTFVWHTRVKASQIAAVELEGQSRQDAGITFTVKQSDHPSGSNVNYRTTLCMLDNRLELQIWQNSVQIKNYAKNDFIFEKDREYKVDMLVGPTWMKVWIDDALTFTAYDLPEYQLYFSLSAANIQAEVSDIQLYNVEADQDAEVLAVKKAVKEVHTGDTLKDVKDQEIPLAGRAKAVVPIIILCTVLLLAAAALGVFGVRAIRKNPRSKEMGGETEQ